MQGLRSFACRSGANEIFFGSSGGIHMHYSIRRSRPTVKAPRAKAGLRTIDGNVLPGRLGSFPNRLLKDRVVPFWCSRVTSVLPPGTAGVLTIEYHRPKITET
jgi:hypothetical protein